MLSDDDFSLDTNPLEQLAPPIHYPHSDEISPNTHSHRKNSLISVQLPPIRENEALINSKLPVDKVTPVSSPRVKYTRPPVKSTTPADPQQEFESAKDNIACGNYLEAAQKLEFVTYQEPDWLPPKTMLIELYSDLRDWKACEAVARSLTRTHPQLVTAHCALAWALRKQAKFQQAIDICTEALAEFPESVTVQLLSIRGECHYDSGNYKQATADFHRSVEIHRRITLQKGGMEKGLKPWKRLAWRLK